MDFGLNAGKKIPNTTLLKFFLKQFSYNTREPEAFSTQKIFNNTEPRHFFKQFFPNMTLFQRTIGQKLPNSSEKMITKTIKSGKSARFCYSFLVKRSNLKSHPGDFIAPASMEAQKN
jgi:hypothetical protein